ncbi:SIMPL domain-containing protein [soil metagenome]
MSSLLNQLKVPFLTVLFTLSTFFLMVRLFGPIPFTVNSITTTKSDLFTVEGTGEVSSVPSTARISVGITKTATTAELAKSDANKVINEITTKLKALGVGEKDIKTSNFSSYPERPFSGRDDISGYTVNENLDVTFDSVDKANKGLDIATAAGANSIGGVQFTIDESKKEELEQQARIEAIKNAKTKAQKLASAAGIRLGRVINITEDNQGGQPVPMYDKAMLQPQNAVSEPTQLNPGENKVQIHVSLSYETL